MNTQRRAAEWLRDSGPVLVTAALLLAASVPLTAQDRSRARPNDSSGSGGRQAVPRSGGSSGSSSGGGDRPSPSYTPPSPSPQGDSRSDSEPPRRTARPSPRDGEPQRQPPSRYDRGGDNGHGHGGHHNDSWYYNRGHHSIYGSYFGWGWGGWGGWGWWGPSYYPYYDPYYYGGGYPRHSYGRGDELGALDLDVSPGRTQVYLDGQYIGKVDAFDGWPQHLWLEKGTYDLAFYLDGYKTVARQVSVYPGVVMSFEDSMEPGDAVRPEDLVTKTHDRRDDRLRNERDQQQRADRGDSRDDRGDDSDWRDRVRRDRERRGPEARRSDSSRIDAREEPGRVRMKIEPEDASVYLDGRFLGTGDELGELHRGLLVDPGEHRLAVVRPGHKSEETEFSIESGQEIELEVELETSGR
jgi:hypothetical protein